MNLNQYLSENGLTALAFARSVEASHVAVGRWIRGTRTPNARMMGRIIRLTSGQVTPNDFFKEVLSVNTAS